MFYNSSVVDYILQSALLLNDKLPELSATISAILPTGDSTLVFNAGKGNPKPH